MRWTIKKKLLGYFWIYAKPYTVNHNILLAKLYKYDIRGNAYDWIANYLNGRTQQVEFDL